MLPRALFGRLIPFRQVVAQPGLAARLFRALFQKVQNILISRFPLSCVFHLKDDVMEQVSETKHQRVAQFVPLRTDLKQCIKEQPMNSMDSRVLFCFHG